MTDAERENLDEWERQRLSQQKLRFKYHKYSRVLNLSFSGNNEDDEKGKSNVLSYEDRILLNEDRIQESSQLTKLRSDTTSTPLSELDLELVAEGITLSSTPLPQALFRVFSDDEVREFGATPQSDREIIIDKGVRLLFPF